jgi:hypothetical protein
LLLLSSTRWWGWIAVSALLSQPFKVHLLRWWPSRSLLLLLPVRAILIAKYMRFDAFSTPHVYCCMVCGCRSMQRPEAGQLLLLLARKPHSVCLQMCCSTHLNDQLISSQSRLCTYPSRNKCNNKWQRSAEQ